MSHPDPTASHSKPPVGIRPRLILLPGVGADARLFIPQREAFPDLHTPGWLPHRPEESLLEYASRMAEVIRPLCEIPPSPNVAGGGASGPVLIGGASFGGMVAYEAARLLPVDGVAQMGSCRHPRAVRSALRAAGPFAPAVPVASLGIAKVLSPLAVEMLINLKRPQRALVARMFQDSDSHFMKWALTSILQWQPSPPPEVPVRAIHGDRDLLIDVKLVEADEVIPGGGHLINLTHADDVNAFIARMAESVAATRD